MAWIIKTNSPWNLEIVEAVTKTEQTMIEAAFSKGSD